MFCLPLFKGGSNHDWSRKNTTAIYPTRIDFIGKGEGFGWSSFYLNYANKQTCKRHHKVLHHNQKNTESRTTTIFSTVKHDSKPRSAVWTTISMGFTQKMTLIWVHDDFLLLYKVENNYLFLKLIIILTIYFTPNLSANFKINTF